MDISQDLAPEFVEFISVCRQHGLYGMTDILSLWQEECVYLHGLDMVSRIKDRVTKLGCHGCRHNNACKQSPRTCGYWSEPEDPALTELKEREYSKRWGVDI
jgi:hypothetical protein